MLIDVVLRLSWFTTFYGKWSIREPTSFEARTSQTSFSFWLEYFI